LLIGSLLTFGFVHAQSNIEEVQMFQAKFGAEKKALVADFIKLQSPAKETFWGIYDQYEKERKDLGLGRVDLLKKYADNYTSLDDAKTNELMTNMIDLMKKNDKLILTYYEKIKKEVGAKPAAQFFQIEGYFLSAIRVAILDEIPFIGELDAHEKK